MEPDKNRKIEGFIFFIEVSILYIIDFSGNICLINGDDRKIKEFKTNNYYLLDNLFFIKKDSNNYLLYDITKNTNYYLLEGKTFFDNFAIIKFIALDQMNKDKNVQIKVLDNPKEELYHIKSKIQFISLLKKDDSSYFLQEFLLNINNKEKLFSFFIYKGQINSINYGLNEENIKNNKSFELIYLSKEKKNLPSSVNVSNYKLIDSDKFNCTNRIRFNIMNVSQDKKIYKYHTELSSLEVIYLINKNNKIIRYGVFDINSFQKRIREDYKIDKEIETFVKSFWDGYDMNKKMQRYTKGYFNNILNQNLNNNLYSKILKKKNYEIFRYNTKSLNKENVFIFFRNYYFFLFLNYLKNKNLWCRFMEYFNLLEMIDKKEYDFSVKISILTDFITNIFKYKHFPIFMDITEFDKENPYNLAIELQKEIIKNMTETSNIFFPLIQFNSKILKILPDNLWDNLKNKIKFLLNKNINEEYAYTISLEDIKEMKSHLLSLQNNYFFAFCEENSIELIGKDTYWTKITTINQYRLCDDMYLLRNLEQKKDYAFSINLVFSHERMGHAKEDYCNPLTQSPNIFFNKDFQKDYIFSDYKGYRVGESGRMFESFISSRCLIKFMKTEKKFGKFLEYKYFIGDFKEINEQAILEFKKTNSFLDARVKYKKYLVLEIIISFFIFLVILIKLFDMKISLNNLSTLSILLILLLLFFRLMYEHNNRYSEPYKFDDIYDTDLIDEKEGNENKLIYPDDYPFESETFLGRHFPFLQFKENKIRAKLKKYLSLSVKNND